MQAYDRPSAEVSILAYKLRYAMQRQDATENREKYSKKII